MSDPAQGDVEIAVEEEGYEVIADDGAEQIDPTAELEAKNAELQAQIEQMKAAQPQQPVDTGFEALAEELKAMRQPIAEEPKQEQVDYSQVIESVKKDFYNDPTKSVLQLMQPALMEIKNESDQRLAAQSVQISKLTALNTPGDSELMMKYQSEVDAIVGGLPPSEKVYQEALQKVKLNHLDDLIAERATAMTEQAIEKAQENVAQNQQVQPQQRQYQQDLSTMAAKPPVQKIKIPQAKLNQLQKWAMVKGYDWNDPESRNFVVGYAKDQGWIN